MSFILLKRRIPFQDSLKQNILNEWTLTRLHINIFQFPLLIKWIFQKNVSDSGFRNMKNAWEWEFEAIYPNQKCFKKAVRRFYSHRIFIAAETVTEPEFGSCELKTFCRQCSEKHSSCQGDHEPTKNYIGSTYSWRN